MTCEEKIMSDNYVDMIEDDSINYRLVDRFEDYCLQRLNDEISVISVNEKEAEKVFPSAEMFSIFPRCYANVGNTQSGIMDNTKFDYRALSQMGITEVQNVPLELTGKHTVFALIGSGIDYKNPLFRLPDGSSRILAIWDQTIEGGPSPAGFSYGREFLKTEIDEVLGGDLKELQTHQEENKLIKASEEREQSLYQEEDMILHASEKSDIHLHLDENGYGTMLAGIAVGQLSGGQLIGDTFQCPAPEADIVVVKVKEAKKYLKDLYCIYNQPAYQENDIMTALSYVRSFVSVTNRPVTAFCTMGTTMGNHAGSGALDRFLQQLLGIRNFTVVFASGDEGNARRHFEGEFRAGDAGKKSVELYVPKNCEGFMLQFWAEKPAVFRLEIISPSGESTGVLQGKKIDYRVFRYVYGNGTLTATYILSEDYSGWQCGLFRFITPQAGIWKIVVEDTDESVDSKYHMWLPMTKLLEDNVYFPISSPYTTLTAPVAEGGLIVASAFQVDTENFAIWSSRGYPPSSEIIPDLAAAGEEVETILGRQSSSVVAAAFVAGATCLLQEWGVINRNDILLDGNEIKHYLLRGAERKTDSNYPNRELGFGRMNLSNTFQKIAGLTIPML